ncbi:hypothetical protein [Polaromonas sp. CG9_12]|nr:hypothetical protein [Polaromonas sp. CG9_12]
MGLRARYLALLALLARMAKYCPDLDMRHIRAMGDALVRSACQSRRRD